MVFLLVSTVVLGATPFGQRQGLVTTLHDAHTCSVATWNSQDSWKQYVSDEFYELFHTTHWPVYKPGEQVDALVFVENYGDLLQHYGKLPVQQYVLFVDDLHWLNAKQEQLKREVFLLPNVMFLSTYAYAALVMYRNIKPNMWKWLPHSAALRFQQPINTTARWDKILLTGEVHATFYPLRVQASMLPMVYQIKHPGYDLKGQNPEFVTTMLQYAVGMASGGNLRRYGNTEGYLVAKFFEIPAAGQLLLANDAMSDVLQAQGLVPGTHYVAYSRANMSTTMRYVLDRANRDDMERIRQAGHTFVMQHHTVGIRAQQLRTLLQCEPLTH